MSQPINLRFTTDNEHLIELCKRYWDLTDEFNFKTKLSELSREFGVPSNRLTRVVSECSAAFSLADTCSRCEAPRIYSNRSDWQQRLRYSSVWTCEDCRGKERELKELERLRAEERYRAVIRERYASVNLGPINPLVLSLEDAVYLAGFTRLLAVEDFSFARSLESVRRSLSPTNSLDLEVLRHLYHGNLITVDPESPMQAFAGDCAEQFYLNKVQWILPIGLTSANPKDLASDIEEVLRGGSWPDCWLNARIDLWKKLALHECLQYLKVALDEHGFVLNPGDKTLLVLNSLLETFSVAQIYNMIWRAAKDAAAFYVREGVTKQHAANMVVGAIQRYGEHAKAERWEVKAYRRHFKCPQSILSDVLFNAVLGIGDGGFYRTPTIGRLPVVRPPDSTTGGAELASPDGT